MAEIKLTGGALALAPEKGSAPYAVPRLVRGDDGLMHTLYVDAVTQQPISSLDGYTVLSQDSGGASDLNLPDAPGGAKGNGGDSDDDLDVGSSIKIDPMKVSETAGEGRKNALANPAGYSTDPSVNYGYIGKPGIVGKALGMFGLPGKAVNLGWNMNNAQAVTQARKALGLEPMSVGKAIKSVFSDNEGQVANVNIGDNTYSVGFEALSPDKKTNLTPMEAIQRARALNVDITENKDKPTAKKKSVLGSVLDSVTTKDKAPEVTNTQKAVAAATPDAIQPTDQTFGTGPLGEVSRSPIADIAPPGYAQQVTTTDMAQAVPTTDTLSPVGSKPASIAATDRTAPRASTNETLGALADASKNAMSKATTANPNDPLGRTPISQVDFDHLGLNPAFAARMKSFADEAQKQGLDLSVDTANARRTAEQQAAIQAAGFSKTPVSYHNTGFALDVSATNLVNKDQPDPETQAKARALAKSMGLGLLSASWDPAHIQAQVPGLTAKSLAAMPQDVFGNVQLSPEQDLNVRQDSVPTPTARPDALDNPSVAAAMYGTAQPDNRVATALASMTDLSQMTPAKAASLGLTQRTDEEKTSIAHALAGELSQKSLQGIANKDPDALSELSNMVTTVENRSTSKMFGSLEDALSPTQYNSLMASNKAVTDENFSKYGSAITDALNGYYSGINQPTSYGLSSYYNPSIANPTWGPQMQDQTLVNEHMFGSLPEYSPNKAFQDHLSSMVSKNYAAPGFSLGTAGLDTPSETNAKGLLGQALNGPPGGLASPGGIGSDAAAGQKASDTNIGTAKTDAQAGKSDSDSDGGNSGGSSSGGGEGGSTSGKSDNDNNGGGGIGHM